MDPPSALQIEKHSRFNVFTTAYKIINDHAITLDVLIPKKLSSGKRPLLVKIHGGALITGDSAFLEWWALWLFDYAILHSAIIISPNYRLLPEAKGLDILSDMNDFFDWIYSDLQTFVAKSATDVEVDTTRVLVYGDSAGAYLSILSAFNQPPGRIRASVAAYPFLDFADPWYHQAFEKQVFGLGQLPAEIVTHHLESMKPGAIVTSATPPERMPLAIATIQHGFLMKFLGDDIRLHPMRMLEEGVKSPADLPKIFIYHGRQDSAVPYKGTEKFDKVLKGLEDGKEKIYISIQEADHGFDNVDELTLDTPWLKEGLEFVTSTWLA